MSRSHQSRAPGPRAIWLLIAAALAIRACVPVGWMPVAGADGLGIMLCDGTGPVRLIAQPRVTHHGGHHAGHHGGHHMDQPEFSGDGHDGHDPCPFGLALGQSLHVSLPPVLELPPETDALLSSPMPSDTWRTLRRGLRPPARGPPDIA